MYAIVAAAGSGKRMGRCTISKNKTFLPLPDGESILVRTLRRIVEADVCRGIIVAVRKGELEAVREMLARAGLDAEADVIAGGASRQESVFLSLESLSGRAKHVLVHDGARPLCSSELIRKVAMAGVESGAAILAVRVTPTLKRCSVSMRIEETILRENLWAAQTPQVFDFDVLHRAHIRACEQGVRATDDAELIERLGGSVSIVEGSAFNIKITTPEDLEIVSALIVRG